MSRVHLVQCLCPARHCIMAATFQEPPGIQEQALELLRGSIEQTIAGGRLNPQCEICKAPRDQWSFEIATIDGVTLDEIMPALRHQEAAQMQTQAAIKAEERHRRN